MTKGGRTPGVGGGIQINFSGPFFQKDPEKTILENVEKMMQGIAEEGSEAARGGLMVGAAHRAPIRALGDRVADHVIGRVSSLTGRKWQTAAVVQVLNRGFSGAEARSLMAAASSVEGETRAFRSVARQLRSARAVLRANLTQGIE